MAQMINPIGPIGPGNMGGSGQAQKAGSTSFKNVLARQLSDVNNLQLDAEKAVQQLATGETRNITEVMAAVEKADLAFRNLMAVRNKIIDAYKEVQQMRI
ncbi:MAG: flagellar hook-basal body complex protein FliE [Planctomycetes bacterium]|nr:flagellar hook-basal body complex protein FliE [Planctomycetota bacterium]